MDRGKIYNELVELVKSVIVDDNVLIDDNSMMTDELGISSFDIVYIVGEVENKYGIKIKLEDVYTKNKFGELVDLVCELIIQEDR